MELNFKFMKPLHLLFFTSLVEYSTNNSIESNHEENLESGHEAIVTEAAKLLSCDIGWYEGKSLPEIEERKNYLVSIKKRYKEAKEKLKEYKNRIEVLASLKIEKGQMEEKIKNSQNKNKKDETELQEIEMQISCLKYADVYPKVIRDCEEELKKLGTEDEMSKINEEIELVKDFIFGLGGFIGPEEERKDGRIQYQSGNLFNNLDQERINIINPHQNSGEPIQVQEQEDQDQQNEGTEVITSSILLNLNIERAEADRLSNHEDDQQARSNEVLAVQNVQSNQVEDEILLQESRELRVQNNQPSPEINIQEVRVGENVMISESQLNLAENPANEDRSEHLSSDDQSTEAEDLQVEDNTQVFNGNGQSIQERNDSNQQMPERIHIVGENNCGVPDFDQLSSGSEESDLQETFTNDTAQPRSQEFLNLDLKKVGKDISSQEVEEAGGWKTIHTVIAIITAILAIGFMMWLVSD